MSAIETNPNLLSK